MKNIFQKYLIWFIQNITNNQMRKKDLHYLLYKIDYITVVSKNIEIIENVVVIN